MAVTSVSHFGLFAMVRRGDMAFIGFQFTP